MGKKIRKVMVSLLFICFCLVINSNTVFAESVIANGTCGDKLTWTLDDAGTLSIDGSGEMYDISSYADKQMPWGGYISDIKCIIIGKEVQSLSKRAFLGCTNLVELQFNAVDMNDVASKSRIFYEAGKSGFKVTFGSEVKKVPSYLFSIASAGEGYTQEYSSLKEVYFADNSVCESIGDYAFDGCFELEKMELPDRLTVIGKYAFRNCGDYAHLLCVKIPNSVTILGDYALAYCNMYDVELPEGLIEIGEGTFSGCENLKTVEIPQTVTNIGSSAFYCCVGMKNISLPNDLNILNKSLFMHCWNLVTIKIPDGVTKIPASCFEECRELSEIIIPENVEVIGDKAFSGCKKLSEVVIPNKVRSLGDHVFSNCTGLTEMIIPDNVYTLYGATFSGCTNLKDVTISKNIIEIGYNTFRDCTSLKKVIIPDNVRWLGEHAFSGCTSLTEITIPDSVKNIWEFAFWNCTSLKEIVLPEQIETINRYTFNNCSNLTRVEIPERVKSIGEAAFKGCKELTSIYIPKTVSDIQVSAFAECEKLSAIYYGESMSAWKEITIAEDNTCLTNAKVYYNCNVIDNNEVGDDNSEAITTVTKKNVVINNDYGVKEYENTPEGEIYDSVNRYIKAMNDYFVQLKKATAKDIKTINSIQKTPGQLLKERDMASGERLVIMSAPYSSSTKALYDSVYETLAKYFDMYIEEGAEMGKIDMSASTINISYNIVNKIRNKIKVDEFVNEVGKYKVRFKINKIGKAYYGYINVEANGRTYIGTMVSDPETTAEALTTYVNDIAGWTEDALYEALHSFYSELLDVTGISDFTDKEIRNFLKGKLEFLQRKGYGDVLKCWLAIKEGNDICNQFSTARNASNLLEAIDDVESLHRKISGLDYSDSTVTNKTVELAMRKINNAKSELERALYNYIYGIQGEKEKSLLEELLDIYETVKCALIGCPVDFVVYDSENNELGRVEDGSISTTNKIYIEVDDDKKTVYVPGDLEVKIEFIGTDTGDMNYVVEQYVDGSATGRVNYYDIPLLEGEIYTHTISNDNLNEDNGEPLVSNEESYELNEYISVDDNEAHHTIRCITNGNGVVVGTGNYARGDMAILTAHPENENYKFVGWYIEDRLVELNSTYKFTVKEDVDVVASFEEVKIIDSRYMTQMNSKYEDVADILVYKNQNDLHDIVINVAGNDELVDLEVNVKGYNGDELVKEDTIETIYDGFISFSIPEYDVSGCTCFDIMTSEDELIGTIVKGAEILIQPVDFTGVVGRNAVFDVEVDGGDITYQWQYQKETSDEWIPFEGDGCQTRTLVIPITEENKSWKYRCKISGKLQELFTDEVSICIGNATDIIAKGESRPTIQNSLTWELTADNVLTILQTAAMPDWKTPYVIPWYDHLLRLRIEEVIIGNETTTIGTNAFYECENLKDVKMGNSVARIGQNAFYECGNLNNVELSNRIKEIRASTFAYSGLSTITLPNTVTTIDSNAFEHCTNLKQISIPDQVTYISSKAFSECNSLEKVTFLGKAPTIECDAFENVTATMHYPVKDETWTADVKQNYGGTLTWFNEAITITNSVSGENEIVENLYTGTSKIAILNLEREDYYGTENEQPVVDGYLFAGWFSDESCTTPFTGTEGTAYAKFVDKDVLKVMAQTTSGIRDAKAGKMRLISSVDSASYQNVGFYIEIEGVKNPIDANLKKVYKKFYAVNKDGSKTYYTPNMISKLSLYFVAFTIEGIPQSFHDAPFKITPYWTTQDGTYVEGQTYTKVVSQMPGYDY